MATRIAVLMTAAVLSLHRLSAQAPDPTLNNQMPIRRNHLTDLWLRIE